MVSTLGLHLPLIVRGLIHVLTGFHEVDFLVERMDCSTTTSQCAWTTDGPGRNNKSNRAANKFGIMEGGYMPDGAIRHEEWLRTCEKLHAKKILVWRTTHEDAETAWERRRNFTETSPTEEPHIERRKKKSPISNNSRTGKWMCKWAMWSETPRRRTGRTLDKCGKHTKLNNCENATPAEQMMKWRTTKLHQKRSWEPLCLQQCSHSLFCSNTLCSWNDGSVLSLVQALLCGMFIRIDFLSPVVDSIIQTQ